MCRGARAFQGHSRLNNTLSLSITETESLTPRESGEVDQFGRPVITSIFAGYVVKLVSLVVKIH